MIDEENYDVSEYDFELPPELIAQRPAETRDASRLLVLDKNTGDIKHVRFNEIGQFLRPNDLLVLNNTKVLPARTLGNRHTGGKVEVFFLREMEEGKCEVMIRTGGSPRPGEFINLEGGNLSVRLLEKRPDGHWLVSMRRGMDYNKILSEIGRMPLPPYIKRDPKLPPDQNDIERYQTVYASETGAVAAPTAGLHFTSGQLENLRADGVNTAEITLHVGVGTFRPIKTDDIREHEMHEEFYSINADAAKAIQDARAAGGRVIAVGTTSCRTLESAAVQHEEFGPCEGWTGLYITPPYEFGLVDAMLTNFHLPRSTLLVLIAAFAGREKVLAAYEEAKSEGYRFYSYGDAMLIV